MIFQFFYYLAKAIILIHRFLSCPLINYLSSLVKLIVGGIYKQQ